jgi:phospholipase/carboxylesterase
LLDATMGLLPPLLSALDALEHAGRYLHPPNVAQLVEALTPMSEPLVRRRTEFQNAPWPEPLEGFRDSVGEASSQAIAALEAFAACMADANPVMSAYRALGSAGRAVAALYPVAFMLPPVNRFFIAPPLRDDARLLATLGAADPGADRAGIIHADNRSDQRGGFSLYVPEYYDAQRAYPLVVALHGGNGHGRSFLWTWLRDARSRGVIVLSATSRQDTWSLMEPDIDIAGLDAMVQHVTQQWNVDVSRILLTGMSDGGSFSYLGGLRDDSPFTHIAPISASFHPFLIEGCSAERLHELPVYLVHGALDWMFNVDVARLARDTLTAAGTSLTYREIDDLSHTYPREENQHILDWFL